MKRLFLFALLIFSVVQITFAQLPQNIIFNKLTKKEGLASDILFHTVQDKTGYLWIATQNGLQRYDGKRFITFRHIPGDVTTIPDDLVNRLFIDSKNRLWLLFEKTIGIFNTGKNTFTSIKINSPVNLIKKLLEENNGNLLLIADYNKRLVYNESKREFGTIDPLPPMPEGLTAGDITKAAVPNRYWLTGKQGLFLYDAGTKQYSYPKNNITGEATIDQAAAILNARLPFVDKDNNFWMVSWIPFGNMPTLYRFDKKNNTVVQFDKIKGEDGKGYYEIWGLYQQSNGTIWIYGMGLLAYYSPVQQRFNIVKSEPLKEYGIEYDYVSNLFEDREKNMWVSTNKGLFRFNIHAQAFANIPNRRVNDTADANVPVTSIVQTKNSDIWISTWGGGVFSYNKNWQPLINPVDELSGSGKFLHASYMLQRSNNEIWIGTREKKIKIYEPLINTLTDVPVPLEQNDAIRQLLEDKKGNIWIGSNDGILLKCPGGNWKNISQPFVRLAPETSFGDILKLYIDKSNFLWICTGTEGLYKMDMMRGQIVQHYKESTGKNDGLFKEGATDIVQYNDSIFLIASNSLCILNTNTNNFRYLTAADGLPAENIINIVIDKQNRIWVALAGGLYRLNLDKKLHVEYGAADGITNNIFEVSTAAKLNDGSIAMGTPYDFVLFNPERTIDTTTVPPVTITGIVFSGRQVPVDSVLQKGTLIMPYDNTAIEIGLSTLPFRNHYRIYYMLKGIDTTWHAVRDNNQIVYPYLPPGSYTLMLKAVNGEGAESITQTSLHLDVNKPFWLTWWFYSLLVLIAGAILFWLDKQRMERKETLQAMRSNIASNLHKDLSTALSDINVLSEMAKLKASKEPQKSIEFIEQIHSRSGSMMTAVEDMMWAIAPENDSMQKALDRLKEHVDMLRNKYSVTIDLLIDKKVETLNLNMKQRQDIYWFLKNGVTNITHTGATNIRMHLGLEKMTLVYTLEFDNSHMDMLQFNNLIQRKELADKLKEANGTINMNTIKSNSVIELKVPV